MYLSRLVRNLLTIKAELGKDGKGLILGSVALGWFLSVGVRYVYPPLLPLFRSEFGLELTGAGVLLSLMWFAYALGQFPGGVLGDRIGEGNILVLSTVGTAAAILVVATSQNVWMLFIGSIAFGFATASYGPIKITIFSDIYSDRAGTAVGLVQASGSIGNTVLPILAVTVASVYSWRAGYGVMVPPLLVVAVALWWWLPGHTSPGQESLEDGVGPFVRRVYGSVTQPGVPLFLTIQILLGFVSQGFLGFYPTYLIEIKGFSPANAATLFGLYFAVGIIVQPLAGMLNDWIGPKETLLGLITLYFVGLGSLYFVGSFLHAVVITLLLSHRNGTGVVANTFLADAMVEEFKGSGLGFLRTVWVVIGTTSPIVVGYLGDVGLFSEAFVLLAALAGLAGLLTLLIPQEGVGVAS